MNKQVAEWGGWVISLPGADDVTIECLPESNLPNALADLGHNLIAESDGERILPSAVTERMIRHEDATFGPLTEGSTRAVSVIIGDAGICKTRRFSFVLP